MKDIQSYVENLKIKKALVGGFDEEAVYTAMKELASIYQEDIIRLKKEKEQKEKEQKEKEQKEKEQKEKEQVEKEQIAKELKEKEQKDKEQKEKDHKAIEDELSHAKNEIQQLKLQLSEVQTNHSIYDSRCDTLARAIDAVNESKDKIIQEAKITADAIIGEAYVKVDRINKECMIQKQQKDMLLSKMSYIKQRFGISMDNLHVILTKLLIEIDELQKDGFDRAFSGKDINEKIDGDENQITIIHKIDRFTNMMAGSVNEHDS